MRPSVDDQKRQIANFTSLTEATNTVAAKVSPLCTFICALPCDQPEDDSL